MKKVIRAPGIKVPAHQLNSVIQVGNVVITSGVSPKDFLTNEWKTGMGQQTLQCLENIRIILDAAGASLEDLVAVEVFINDVRYYREFNDAWNEFFKDVAFPPTRSTFQVGLLAPNMHVEMKAVAVMEGK